MLPEVITFSCFRITVKTCDTLWRNAYFLCPDFKSFLVLPINRWIKTIWIKFENLCKELPRPGNSLMLEIISKRKVTKHLKKSKMASRLTYIINVSCSNTFLTSSNALSWWNLLPCKIWLKWCHTSIDKK